MMIKEQIILIHVLNILLFIETYNFGIKNFLMGFIISLSYN